MTRTRLQTQHDEQRRYPVAPTVQRSQRGAALAMALVILLVLTLIGVTAMNVSSLEARMAGNTQESVRAFQLAESAIQEMYQQPSYAAGLARVGASATANFPSTTATIRFMEISKTAGRNSTPGISGTKFRKAHFQVQAETQTTLGGKSSVTQGFAMDIPPE